MLGRMFQDLRYAVRMLARSPAFTAVAVLTLSLGIGANTAIFSVANSVLFRPLPYRDPSRLLIVTNRRGPNRRSFSYGRAAFIDKHSNSFAGFAPFVTENFNLTGRGDPELLPSARVAWNFFDVLGVRPVLGRAFRIEERLAAQPTSYHVLRALNPWSLSFRRPRLSSCSGTLRLSSHSGSCPALAQSAFSKQN